MNTKLYQLYPYTTNTQIYWYIRPKKYLLYNLIYAASAMLLFTFVALPVVGLVCAPVPGFLLHNAVICVLERSLIADCSVSSSCRCNLYIYAASYKNTNKLMRNRRAPGTSELESTRTLQGRQPTAR
jgi:hypothetical protein